VGCDYLNFDHVWTGTREKRKDDPGRGRFEIRLGGERPWRNLVLTGFLGVAKKGEWLTPLHKRYRAGSLRGIPRPPSDGEIPWVQGGMEKSSKGHGPELSCRKEGAWIVVEGGLAESTAGRLGVDKKNARGRLPFTSKPKRGRSENGHLRETITDEGMREKVGKKSKGTTLGRC